MSSRHHVRAAAALVALLPALAVLGPTTHADAARDRVTAQRATVTVTGRVVRFANGRPVRGVRVSAYDAGDKDFLAADLTDADGRFAIVVGDRFEEFGVYVQGGRVGLQNGWVACDHTLRAVFGDACTFPTTVGKVRVKAS